MKHLKIYLLLVLFLAGISRPLVFMWTANSRPTGNRTLFRALTMLNFSPLPLTFDRAGYFSRASLALETESGRILQPLHIYAGYEGAAWPVRRSIKHGMLHPQGLPPVAAEELRRRVFEDFYCRRPLSQFSKNNADTDSVAVGRLLLFQPLLNRQIVTWSYKCSKR